MAGLHFQTRDVQLDLEGIPFSLTLIDNTEDLLDALLAKGEAHEDVIDEKIPYWADLWPSAVALGRHLIKEQVIKPGDQVTEIGCGLGLAGIVAGKLGAEVTLTDYLPAALDFARRNWERNVHAPARFELLDWRKPDPALAADLLLASDVAYEKRFFDELPPAFRTLCRPGGRILLSEPNRAIAGDFLKGLPALGFAVKTFVYTGTVLSLKYRVNVYDIQYSV